MTLLRFSPLACLVGLSLLGFVSGCGGSTTPQTSETEASGETPPALSLNGPKDAAKEAPPAEGSPAWILNEIHKIRAEKTPASDDAAKTAAHRRERNEKIVTLATAAIAATHDDAGQEEMFTAAVHQLMEARLQLALAGEKEDVDGLYEDVATLEKTKPKSQAAAEAAFIRARFAHMNAQRFSEQEPRWLDEFAKQARLFANQYPDEETRGSMLLHAAGWSCELHRKSEEAVACYTTLSTNFPAAPQATQASAAIRRLQLNGQPLELAGPTPEGGFTRIDDYAGKSVLIVFWASDAGDFEEEMLPKIQAVADKYGKYGLVVLGVNLDEDEADLKAFVEKHSLTWPQIFHPDPQQRRWNNPVVKHYGVRDIPAVWLVDHEGNVVDTQVDVASLEKVVKPVMAKHQQASK